ncbi:hypothetical protein BSL78_14782 [Apostichopus japonicus]|uniref:Protein SERAC1 n=1 Tax=Stichopus japonicus TaxID=307972 RepID=A0A2G8KK01_STIJA|nr:hypothetical protein BSL78_14782 [Apostichopus japonicus]
MTSLTCLRRISNQSVKEGKISKFSRKVKVGSALLTCAASGGLLYVGYRHLDKSVHYKPEVTGSEGAGKYIYLKPFNAKQDDLVTHVKSKVQWNYHALESIVLENGETGWTSFLPFGRKKHRLWNDPRLLLLKAQSENREERLAAVRALAKRHIWHDHEYRMVAQSCDRRTLIGLARINNVDERFFLPPPTVQTSEETVEDELRKLLATLPKTSIDPCTKYFTMLALREGQSSQADDQTGSLVFGGNHLSFITSLSKVPEESLFSSYLLALVSHSEVISHCKELVRLGALQILMRIYQRQPHSPKVNCYLAQIIANMAVCEALHAEIVQAGWVTLLVKWKKSKFTELASQASRALANLDRDDINSKEVRYANGINIIHPLGRTRKPIHADVVFVHGLMGGAFYTWRQGQENQDKEKLVSLTDGALATPMNDENQIDSERPWVSRFTDCWPKSWLAKDCPNIRILTITYDTQLTEWVSKCPFESEKRSISQRSGEIIHKLREAGLGQRPIIWVTHSMGGLLVKQMILDSENLASDETTSGKSSTSIAGQTRAVIFYSTPHHGTSLAAYSQQAKYLLLPSVEVKELVQGSPYLRSLHGRFRAFVQAKQIPILSFGEKKATNIGLSIRTLVVPASSSNPGFGEHYDLDMNHLNICKPASHTSPLYQLTLQFINTNLQQSFTSELTEKLSHELEDDESEKLLSMLGMTFGD